MQARLKCPVCGTELEVEPDDWHSINNYVECLVCKYYLSSADKIGSYGQEFETYLYPDDFTDFSVGKDMSDDWINGMIREGVNYLKNNPDEIVWYTATGNTLIIIFSYSEDEEYCVSVAKNYKEVNIPYGQEGNL